MFLLLQNIFMALILAVSSNLFHSIHISYGEAEAQTGELHGRITFYKDDFFLALRNWKGSLLQNMDNKQYDKLKLNYLQNHLTAEFNDGRKLILGVTSCSENEKSIWFDFEFKSDRILYILKIKYNVIMKEYGDQMNLLNLKSRSGNQSFVFSKSKQEIVIKF